jgi:hypothetical protein
MRNSNLTYAILFTALAVMQFSCKKEKVVAKPDATINELVDATEIPEVPMDQLLRKDSLIEAVVINGVTSNCLTFNVQQTRRITDFDYLYGQDQSEIWPGSLVQSKFLRTEGRLISLGGFPRDPLQYHIIGSMGTKSFDLSTPSRSTFNDEMNESTKLFWFMPPVFSSQKTQITYSSEQALMELGINFNFLRSGLKTNFQISGSNDHTTMFMLVKSIYFNVTVDYPSKPSDFFGYETDVENLKRVSINDNSPAYVSNVSYGRFALVKMKSSKSQQKTKMAIDLLFKGLSASLTTEQKNILQTLDLTIEAAPGSSTSLRTIEDVYSFINDGFEFNHRTGYVPVGFEARYLKDNSPLITHTVLGYKVISCL